MTRNEFKNLVETDFWKWVAPHDRTKESWLYSMEMWSQIRAAEAKREST